MTSTSRSCFIALALLTWSTFAGSWPDDHTVLGNSTSPNGRYAVLVVSREAGLNDERTGGDNETYLADLQTHQTIGEIKGIDYFEGQNHAGLAAYWAPDSKACVVQYDGRYGWESVSVLKLKEGGFDQVDIGKHIDVVQKRIFNGYMTGYYRFSTDGKLKVRATSYTNPKQFEEVPTYNGLFQGTFDLKTETWLTANARKVKSDDWNNLESAYNDDFLKQMIVVPEGKEPPEDFSGAVLRTEEEKFEELDKQLNAVYQTARLVVAPSRFSKVKQEQVAWLKTREAARTVEEKSKLTETRIKTLQVSLW